MNMQYLVANYGCKCTVRCLLISIPVLSHRRSEVAAGVSNRRQKTSTGDFYHGCSSWLANIIIWTNSMQIRSLHNDHPHISMGLLIGTFGSIWPCSSGPRPCLSLDAHTVGQTEQQANNWPCSMWCWAYDIFQGSDFHYESNFGVFFSLCCSFFRPPLSLAGIRWAKLKMLYWNMLRAVWNAVVHM